MHLCVSCKLFYDIILHHQLCKDLFLASYVLWKYFSNGIEIFLFCDIFYDAHLDIVIYMLNMYLDNVYFKNRHMAPKEG